MLEMPNGKLAEILDSVQVDITLETKIGNLLFLSKTVLFGMI